MIKWILILASVKAHALSITVETPVENVEMIKVYSEAFKRDVWTCPSGTMLAVVKKDGVERLGCFVVAVK